jgi:hypothetical protein
MLAMWSSSSSAPAKFTDEKDESCNETTKRNSSARIYQNEKAIPPPPSTETFPKPGQPQAHRYNYPKELSEKERPN